MLEPDRRRVAVRSLTELIDPGNRSGSVRADAEVALHGGGDVGDRAAV